MIIFFHLPKYPIYELQEIQNSVSQIILSHHKVEEEKQLLTKQLFQSQKMQSIGLLVGGLIHDLNNLLTSIVCYPDHIIDQLPKNSSLRHPLELMRNAGENAADMVGDLLTLTRGVTCKKAVTFVDKSLDKYLKSSEHLFLIEKYPNVRITIQLDQDLWPILASAIHINKMIVNLVRNAIEAIEHDHPGDIVIAVQNKEISTAINSFDKITPGEYVTFTIKDDGRGITADNKENIFDPFFSTKKMDNNAGSGLGLTIVWNIVQEHDGLITFDSGEGKGTKFTVFIPPYFTATLPEPNVEIKNEILYGSGERILIVEDDKIQAELLQDILNNTGFHSEIASDKKSATSIFEEKYFDLVLLDMVLGQDSGLDVYKKVLEFNPKQKALIISGYSKSDNFRATIELGAHGYVKKPYRKAQLLKKIKETLNSSFKGGPVESPPKVLG